MKIIQNILFVLITYLFTAVDAFAVGSGNPNPPPPNGKRPPPPPGLPIDENLSILLLIALLFGIYIIYSHRLKTKTPI